MRKTILAFASMALAVLLASGVVLAQQTTPPVPEQTPAVGELIPGRYIVVLEEADEREGHDPAAVSLDHDARHHGAKVLHTYQHAVQGYAARIPDRRR